MREARLVTLYDQLGVGRDVDSAELRRAYRARARELHPDANHAGRAGGGAAEGQAMAHLNAIWEILGDPVRRAEYDRLIEAPRPDPEQSPPLEGTLHGRRFPLPLPWAILGAAMLVIFVITAYAGHPTPPPPPDVTGLCLRAEPGIDRFVTCSPSDAQAVQSVSRTPDQCGPGTVPHLVQGPARYTACLAQGTRPAP